MTEQAPHRPDAGESSTAHRTRELVAYADRGGSMRIVSWTTGVGEPTLLIATCRVQSAVRARARHSIVPLMIDPKGNANKRAARNRDQLPIGPLVIDLSDNANNY